MLIEAMEFERLRPTLEGAVGGASDPKDIRYWIESRNSSTRGKQKLHGLLSSRREPVVEGPCNSAGPR